MALDVLTAESLKTELQMWQQFLRLQDWNISAEIVEAGEFEGGSLFGLCNFWVTERRAEIKIVSEESGDRLATKTDYFEYYSMSKTLLHEMLHVFFAPLSADDSDIFLEQKINHLTSRLINAKWWAESVVKTENASLTPVDPQVDPVAIPAEVAP